MLESHEHKHAEHNFDGITENRENSPPAYFTILFYGLILWGVIFCAFYLFSGWSSDAEFHEKMQAHETKYQPPQQAPATKMPPPTSAPPQKPAAPAAVVATPAATPEIDAKGLFASRCAMCHGADGKGGFGPDLTAAELEYGKTREGIFLSVSQGRGNGKMPAFEGQLKREEIYALADYLLTLK